VTELVVVGDDGESRCWWPGDDELYKICLEGFQSGLAWITILRKRKNFRSAFSDFDIETVAGFGPADVERLLGDAGIVRHRRKIESTINNARRALDIVDEAGSLAAWIWSFEPSEPEGERDGEWPIPSITPTSTRLSRELKERGWTWVGPTTVYAFMQAMGLVNDHLVGCAARERVETARSAVTRPTAISP
jgi:DNA-3-methyladenine glycosylase I